MIYHGCCASAESGGGSKCSADDTSSCPTPGTIEKAFSMVCNCLDLSRSTISHHFKELQNAGLITCERNGQSFRCRVNGEAISSITELFGE